MRRHSFTDEEVEVIREGLDLLLSKRRPREGWSYAEARARAIAEELYSAIRVELAA